MQKLIWLSKLMGASGVIRTKPSLAIAIKLIPDSATVVSGDLLGVDVVISGLGDGDEPSVGAFDLDVSFDSTIFSPTDVTFGPFLGDPDPFAFETLTDFNFLSGVVDLAEVSLLSPAELDALGIVE